MYLSDIMASVLSWPKLQTTARVAYATSTFPMMYLIYPPPPLPREIAYAKFGVRGGGGGANKVHYGKYGSGE